MLCLEFNIGSTYAQNDIHRVNPNSIWFAKIMNDPENNHFDFDGFVQTALNKADYYC